MKLSFDHAAALKILWHGLSKNYWTLEQLDTPPPGTKLTLDEWKRHPMNKNLRIDPPTYRNLLRDNTENSRDDFIL